MSISFSLLADLFWIWRYVFFFFSALFGWMGCYLLVPFQTARVWIECIRDDNKVVFLLQNEVARIPGVAY